MMINTGKNRLSNGDGYLGYEDLLKYADKINLCVREVPLETKDGLIKGNRVAIRGDIQTSNQKYCVLAEEIGHYVLTVGNILDQKNTENRKQEKRARIYAYNKIVGICGIISAFESNCLTLYEMADYLDVTEEFLKESIQYYKEKYGIYTKVNNYIVYFIPSLAVVKLFE